MPIRLNLFAEDQAIEALRRRDPVKRAVLAGVVLVVAILVWSSTLMFKMMAAKSDVSTVDGGINSQTNSYAAIVANEKKLAEDKEKVRSLQVLVTNRFLTGSLLDALQRTVVEHVQVTRLKLNQNYVYTEEVKPKGDDDKRAPKPATVTEKISLVLNATDTSPNGEAATRFQNALSATPYFQQVLGKTNGFRLTSVGAPQANASGQTFTTFTLEAFFPEKTR
jgi:hypothetical protein